MSSNAPVQVRVAERSVWSDLRAVKIVWQRDMIRNFTDRTRVVISFVQPVLFLFVLGTGLSTLTNGERTGGLDLRTFMYPGVLAMTVLFTSFFSAGSLVWDREFGFLREILVAPVRRWSIVVGKALAGASLAVFQGVIFLCLAGAVHVPYDPVMLVTLIAELTLLAFTLTAFGVMVAARVTQFQSFMAMVNVLLQPMYFLSGALFPLSGLPVWLRALTVINPVTYAIDPMRHAVFDQLHVSPEVRAQLVPGVSWFGWRVPVGLELVIVAAIGLLMVGLGVLQFRKAE